MTVQSLLKNMTQQELCHWMAYHRLETEEHEKLRESRSEARSPYGAKKAPQPQKKLSNDEAMLSQLLRMAKSKR